ncbi:MAG TPA: hypothetical protein VFM82_09755 [Flavobacteriaceae bacterium]|nr:hypothetical protein [Flavobacteriaceae bacterium]
MKRKNYLKLVRFLFLLVCGTGLLFSCSKDNDSLPTQISMNVAEGDFSQALEEWNDPENFTLKEGQTPDDLLQNRLKMIQKDTELLLISSGKTREEINSLNLEQKFLAALDIYGKNNNNFKN